MRPSGFVLAAMACSACAREISSPSGVTVELSDMFCDLNGATFRCMSENMRHSAAAIRLLPAPDVAPSTMMGLAETAWTFSTSALMRANSPSPGRSAGAPRRERISLATSVRWGHRHSMQDQTSWPSFLATVLPSRSSMQGYRGQ